MAVEIRNIRAICTAPAGSNLVVVKVETSEPGLYGLGCATYTQRFRAVVSALDEYYSPLLIGRDVSRIEDLFHLMMVNGYWRNGPVLNNAISGIDMALWDIKGKIAGMPVYDLLGGCCRSAAQVYVHANGDDPSRVLASAAAFRDEGYRFIRVQHGGYGGGAPGIPKPENAPDGVYFDPGAYRRDVIATLEHVRNSLGDDIELLHDVHERLSPTETLQFASDLERFRLYFLEDAFAPEDVDWFERLRALTTTPLAMGELFNNPVEWKSLISGRLIDYIRVHISQIGGITPARHLVSFASQFGVRTAWHGPGDVSPVGHAANLHLDLWAPNFGIQEWCRFPEHVYEVFPGTPRVRNGYLYANGKPGLGIDVDETLAAKYPCNSDPIRWTQVRRPDGSPARP